MMPMSVKIIQALKSYFSVVERQEFDEYTIRHLLIVSREYINNNGLIKELAHFVAHPERNKGMCHDKVNNRYAKLKLIDDQFIRCGDRIYALQNERQLSDFMLGGIQVDKIEAKIFKILYFDGIEDISENHLTKFCGIKKKEAKKLLKESYDIRDGFYLYNNKGSKEKLDRLERVIRGTIEYRSVFKPKELNNELKDTLNNIINSSNLDRKFVKAISENKNDILLCIMTLLHDTKFLLYDDNIARTYMCFYLDPPSDSTVEYYDYDVFESMKNNGRIALYVTYSYYGKTNCFPFFISTLSVNEYFDFTNVKPTDSIINMMEIPWTTAKRIKGKLMLVRTEIS